MLVLTRKQNDRITIGDNITITVLRLKGNTVRIGIDAPNDVRILRGEIPQFDVELDSTQPAATLPAEHQPGGRQPQPAKKPTDTVSASGAARARHGRGGSGGLKPRMEEMGRRPQSESDSSKRPVALAR